MLNLVLLNKMLLLECFDSIYLLGIPLLTEYDLSIGACSYDLYQIEIINLEAAIMQLQVFNNHIANCYMNVF